MDGLIAMLPAPIQKLSTHHDYQGQLIAERTFQVIMVLGGIIGFVVGFYTQQLSNGIFVVIGSAIFSALIVLPPWPFLFRKNPIQWQPVQPKEESKKKK
ncbi:unnamed protein product [Caenorhabditis auriculariae]|uniref:Signal peptidase complex subunit 1 n=1 Tax=Caenorhabditis auriculariae TaxID=2777116 RepID=A0A8S1GMM0_9PELO|nr:unnamed protein product [Caenorhabditis auriculariae]